MWLGDFPEDFTAVTCAFTTHEASGAPVAPNSAFEAADVLIYKNGSNAQKTTTNGVTMTSPFDSVTGLHVLTIDTSNDTGDSGFWVAGAVYTLVLSADETVDSVTVLKVIGQFGIDLQGALKPTTAGRKLDVSAGGEAGVDWANIGSPTTAVNLSGTTVKTATDVETDTADIQSRLPAALGANGNIKADVRDFNGAAGTFASGRAEVNVSHFGGSAGTFSSGRPEVNSSHISGSATAADNAEIVFATDFATNYSITTDKWQVEANVLQIEGSDATNQIRDSIVDDATRIDASALNTLSSHDPGETIMGATDLGTGSGLTSLASQASVNTIDGIVDAILVDTGTDIPAALVTIDDFIDTEVAAIKAVTDKLDDTLEDDGGTYRFTANALEEAPTGGGGGATAAEIADAVWDEARADHTTAGTFGQGAASVQGNVTGSIGSLATQAKADVNAEADTALADAGVTTTVTGRIDAAITTRLASAGYTAPDNSSITAIKAKTDSLAFTVPGQVDSNIQSVNDVTVNGNGAGTPWGP